MNYHVSSRYDEEQRRWRVDLSGEVDIFTSPEFREYLLLLTDKAESDMTINCARLEYLDSTALGSLVSVLKRVRSYSGRMALAGLKPNIAKLFKVTSLDKVFDIEGD